MNEPGIVVVLNGTSSAGKSSIARALQELMPEPYLHSGTDHILPRLSPKFTVIGEEGEYFGILYDRPVERTTGERSEGEYAYGQGEVRAVQIGPGGLTVLRAMYAALAAVARAGINAIADVVLHDPRELSIAVDELRDVPVLFVGVHVPLDMAIRRERERADRGPGGARAFYDLVHRHTVYDVEIDTSEMDPEQAARRIREVLVAGGGDAMRAMAARGSL